MSTSIDRLPRARRFIAGALSLVIVAATSPALGVPSDADRETAIALYKQGADLEAAGDLHGACTRYEGAFKLVPSPKTALKLGQLHEQLGELVEARQVYLRGQTVTPEEYLPSTMKDESESAKQARIEATKRAEALKARIPSVLIKLENLPKGVEPQIQVDGENIPIEALSVPRLLNPGKHTVFVATPGQPGKKSTLEVSEGQTRVVSIDLTPEPEPVVPKADSRPQTSPVTLDIPSSEAPRGSDVEPNRTGPGVVSWIGFGVGGAGVIVGSISGIVAIAKGGTVKDNCQNNVCPPAFHDDLDTAKRSAAISTIAFGVGLVGIGIGVWGLLTGSSTTAKESKSASVIEPWIGLGSVGVSGAF